MNRNLSIYLDLVRALAALVVVFDHTEMAIRGSYLWHFPLLGHEAVIVFFVLSGFVIAYSADIKDRDLGSYAVSRFSRLYSVVLPCLIIAPLLDFVGRSIDPAPYIDHVSAQIGWLAVLQNGLFLNQAWFANVPYFGNAPFWSLGYEFWYYVIFAAAYFLRGWARGAAVIICCLFIGPKVLLLMPIWLMGAGAYWIVRRGVTATYGLPLLTVSLLALGIYFEGHIDVALNHLSAALIGPQYMEAWHFSRFFLADTALGLMITLNFIGFAGISSWVRQDGLAPFIRGFAGFTFSIYLFHLPLIYFTKALLPKGLIPDWQATLVLIGAIGGSCVIGLFTEHKKHVYTRIFKAILARWPWPGKAAHQPL
jgi:peptidoglycan/LPS O-acetylase OafA/YrhL